MFREILRRIADLRAQPPPRQRETVGQSWFTSKRQEEHVRMLEKNDQIRPWTVEINV
jgi:hypothetical protein